MNKAILNRNLRKLHLWFGIGIGLQLGLWLISGLFMTLFPIDQVRGTHSRAEHAPQIVTPNLDLLGPADIVSKHTLRPQSLTHKILNERPVYIVTTEAKTQVFDAKTGDIWETLDEALATKIAVTSYTGRSTQTAASFFGDKAPREYGRDGPVWRIDFKKPDAASFYMDATTAEVKADPTQNARTDYIPGPAGPLARIKRMGSGSTATETVTYLHTDHLGTARAGTDATGTVLWEDFHTPFGDSLIAPTANDNQGDYTGHIRDSGSGLTYMQARYYDPVVGRFLSIDPVGFMSTGDPGMFNRYGYAFNDPLNLVDPNGENPARPIVGKVVKKQVHKPLKAKIVRALGGGEKVSTAVDIAFTDFSNPAGAIGDLILDKAGGKYVDKVADKLGQSFDKARETAFKKTGMTDGKVNFTMEDKTTGTITEFTGNGGAKVGYDGPHPNTPGKATDYHDQNHVGSQTAGKRNSGMERENHPYSGDQHATRQNSRDLD